MSHGYNANFRNSGQPNQTLVFGGGFQGNANPLPVVLNPFQAIANIVCGDTLSSTINVQSFSSFFRTSNLFTSLTRLGYLRLRLTRLVAGIRYI